MNLPPNLQCRACRAQKSLCSGCAMEREAHRFRDELVALRELAAVAERYHLETGHEERPTLCDSICKAWKAWKVTVQA